MDALETTRIVKEEDINPEYSKTLSYAAEKPWETEILLEEADGEVHGNAIAEFDLKTLADGTGGKLHYKLTPRSSSFAWGAFLGGATLTLAGLAFLVELLQNELHHALERVSLPLLILGPILLGVLVVGILSIVSSFRQKPVNVYEILIDDSQFVVSFNGLEIKNIPVKEIRDLWLERVLTSNPQLREHVFNLTTADEWSASIRFMAPFDLNPKPIEQQLRSFLKLKEPEKTESPDA